MIIISTAPPCEDHSRIRGKPPGLSGQDGSLLQHMVDIEFSLRQLLPECRIETLMENVLPHALIQEQFDEIIEQWGTQPIVLDAADGNMVSRPRLWWDTIRWEQIQETISTQTPWQLRWSNRPPYSQLHNPIVIDLQPDIHRKGERWEQGHKQFPPWQYRPQFLTREHEGEWQPITPIQRERLMGFPDSYTQPTPDKPFSDRQRNSMLGNAWRLPTAIWLFFLLLVPVTSTTPRTLTSALDQMTQAWLNKLGLNE